MHSSTRTRTPRSSRSGRVPWYATSPRTRLIPPWYVWCGVLSLLCGIAGVVLGRSPAELIFGVLVLAATVIAWRR